MKALRVFSRFFVGIVFVFSGFVKAVDPLGSKYKFLDYFEAFNMTWMDEFALVLGIILAGVEFLLGIAFIFNLRMKLATWTMMAFMLFFSGLTLILAIDNPVPDCGCFGDAIILTNWQTFYKNLIIFAFLLVVFFSRKKSVESLTIGRQYLLLFIFTAGILGVSIFGLRHLPMIDFRAWKVGSSMLPDETGPPKSYVTYKDKATGEETEYPSDDFPWNDSTWMAQHEFVSSRVEELDRPDNLLRIEDEYSYDVSLDLMQSKDFHFLVISYFVDESFLKGFEKVNAFADLAMKDSLRVVGITGSLPEETEVFRHEVQSAFSFYWADEIALKTVVRANPGILLIKEGYILDKWHWRDLPEFSEFKEKMNDYDALLEEFKSAKKKDG